MGVPFFPPSAIPGNAYIAQNATAYSGRQSNAKYAKASRPQQPRLTRKETIWTGGQCPVRVREETGIHRPFFTGQNMKRTGKESGQALCRNKLHLGRKPSYQWTPDRLERKQTAPLLLFSFFFTDLSRFTWECEKNRQETGFLLS